MGAATEKDTGKRVRFGDMELFPLTDGLFRLDGGAMFGVVPKVLWEKSIPPDERNRIALGLGSLLVMTGDKRILIDTGIGDKGDARFNSIYAVERTTTLLDSLRSAGVEPEDIDIVINSHLHFDHAGGNTVITPDGMAPAFPNARYVVQRRELEAALYPNERTRASYRSDDFIPLLDAGAIDIIDGDTEVEDGVRVEVVGGHTPGYQSILMESCGKRAVWLGDIIPTAAHLKPAYIPGYDLFPLESLDYKKELIGCALEHGWLLVFCHDPAVRMGHLREAADGLVIEEVRQS